MIFLIFLKTPLLLDFFWPACCQFWLTPLGLDRGLVQWPLFRVFGPPMGTTFWPGKTVNFPIFPCAEPLSHPLVSGTLGSDNSENAEISRKCLNWSKMLKMVEKWSKNSSKSGQKRRKSVRKVAYFLGEDLAAPVVGKVEPWKITKIQENH